MTVTVNAEALRLLIREEIQRALKRALRELSRGASLPTGNALAGANKTKEVKRCPEQKDEREQMDPTSTEQNGELSSAHLLAMVRADIERLRRKPIASATSTPSQKRPKTDR
jgi:hypothetical protein